MDMKAGLADAEQERDLLAIERERLIAEIDAQIAELDDEIKGLKLAISRHNGEAELSEAARKDWASMKRIDAVWEILAVTTRGLSPKAIADRLAEVGRADTPTDVSQTLQYMKKKGEVTSRGRGKWVLIELAADADTGGSASANPGR